MKRAKSTRGGRERHELARTLVASRIKRRGLNVQAQPCRSLFDLLVNGVIRVAIKGAERSKPRPQTVNIGGKTYHYLYRMWHFNFHRHGRLVRYADFVCCVALGTKPTTIYVIPWEEIRGKTFGFHQPKRKRSYNGHYAPYLDGWQAVINAARKDSRK